MIALVVWSSVVRLPLPAEIWRDRQSTAAKTEELIATDVPGLHFYTMDRSKSAVRIINRLRYEGFL